MTAGRRLNAMLGMRGGRIPASVYVRLVAELHRADRRLGVMAVVSVAALGAAAALRANDPWLALLGLAATILALVQRRLLLEGNGAAPGSFGAALAAERRFAHRAWLSAAASGALAGYALLAGDDPVVHLLALILVLTVAVTAMAGHVRPHIPIGQCAAALGPAALALALRGEAASGVLAGAVLILGHFIIAASLALYRKACGSLATDEALQAQNLRFDAALNNMAQGLCMFDPDGRLLVFNASYLAIYRLDPAVVAEGMSLEALLAHSSAVGNHPERSADDLYDALVARFALQEPARFDNLLGDGRTIAVSIEPTAFGGWVATHEDVTERKAAEAHIVHLARHDPLSGLANRLAFRETLEEALVRVGRGEQAAVFTLDLDRFKTVNDTLGHAVGDAVLREAAARLQRCVRATDTVARLGGDEFAVVQLGSRQPGSATRLAERILRAMDAPFEVEGHCIAAGISIGVSIAPEDGCGAERLIRNADLALYRAKSQGRRQFRFFAREMDEEVQARRSLELDLRSAVANGEFSLAYQPLVDVRCGRVSGFEALIRWHHPRRGIVMPGDFIPLAEEIGLIEAIGAWVVQEACAAAAGWQPHIRIAVNLSPAQFRSGRLVETVSAALASSRIDPCRLELEITEGVLLADNDETLATLHRLRALGVRIAMDDFGTGYSSLGYLRAFPFDKIKIDRSFVKDIGHDDEAMAIVRAVTDLGARLGMTTTAEGVETVEQLESIRANGCTEVQGYLLGRPIPEGEILAFMASRSGGAARRAA